MCGLCGIVINRDSQQSLTVQPEILEEMNNIQIHRGPDQGRVLVLSGGLCGLANRRLAIQDLSPDAALPMQRGHLTLAYNGEIYNHLDLRPPDVAFRTHSDTETILYCYERYGLAFLEQLRGMFALALWDADEDRLILARDRMGQKPLYYYFREHDGLLVFASEIKALLACPEVPRQPDESRLAAYLSYGYVPAPDTFWKDIQMLLPGHQLAWQSGKISIVAFWEQPFPTAARESSPKDIRRYKTELYDLFVEAVRLRLLSDVPLGAFLSGGLDSSLIVAAMAHHASGDVKTFAIGFQGEPSFDETAHAERVARHLETQHETFIVKLNAIDLLPRLVWYHDSPFADSSAIPTYTVSQMARQHVTVALSGDGGDELFAGYERFHAAHLAAKFRILPGFVKKGMAAGLRVLPEGTGYRNITKRARRFIDGALLPESAAYFNWIRLFDRDWLNALFPNLDSRPDPSEHFSATYFPESKRGDLTARLLYANVQSYLPDDLLIKADRCSMAVSLENRAPFLDHKLVEYAATIPANLKLSGGITKFILKEMARGILPDEIIDRPKHGFGVPLGRWFREDLRTYAQDILLDSRTLQRGIVNENALRRLLDEHINRKRDHGQRIWTLLTLEWWYRLFVDKLTLQRP